MSAVVSFIEDVVGGIVEAIGSVVDTVADVVRDVGEAVDKYVIQPILKDPIGAIATVAAVTFLGPEAASLFGTSSTVGAGIAAAGARTTIGLAEGQDFDTALKNGLVAGVTTFAGGELFGGGPNRGPQMVNSSPLDEFLASNNNFSDVSLDTPQITPPATTPELPAPATISPVTAPDLPPAQPLTTELAPPAPAPTTELAPPAPAPTTEVAPPAPSPLESVAPPATTPEVPSPLESLKANLPKSEVTFPDIPEFKPDFSLSNGLKPTEGLQAPSFAPDAPVFDLYGNPDFSLTPPGTTGGPGLQIPKAPSLPIMGGGQGLTANMTGLPQYTENGLPTTFEGANGKTYGNPTPDVTVSQNAIRPTPLNITYDATTNSGTPPPPNAWDQLKSGNLMDAAKIVGSDAVDWVKANPWTAASVGLTAATTLGSSAPVSANPPPAGSTQDKNFTKSLDLYNYMRDKNNYGGDITKYGQAGQSTPGEHQFFQNTRFVPVPIPGAKMGGLIQMKHFAQGGPAQGMQDPRRAQMMAAMAQQHAAGQGGPMGMAQGRPPMMPGGQMPQRPPMMPQQGGPQGMPPQGMPQGRPQMPQRPRDPKMAYYQYGNPPSQAMAMGGLSQVHSMRIGGGADGRSDDVNAVLSDGEYVMDAETVAMLGNGSSKAGAAKLDQMRANLRKQKGQALAHGKISPNAKSPLAYLKGA